MLFTRMNFRGDAEFTTWLYRMTLNACIDETRKARRLFGLADWFTAAEPGVRTSLDGHIRSSEIAREVKTVLGGLIPKFLIPLVLKYVEERAYQKIAYNMYCSRG